MEKWKRLKIRSKITGSDLEDYKNCIETLICHDKVQMMKQFNHHSSISCLEHSINVSLCSYLICKALRLDYKSAAKGGLLHDLFLYDWRITKLDCGMHGFVHPKIALTNATKLFQINDIEKDIIIKHMFPLTIYPPIYKESLIVCLIDKICATLEFFGISFINILNNLMDENMKPLNEVQGK